MSNPGEHQPSAAQSRRPPTVEGTPATDRGWAFYTEPLRVEVGGVEVAYRRHGAGEPMLYLHGAGLTRRWLPLYERLSRSVDLLVPEHPGFGDSTLPEWFDSFDDAVLHYAEFLDQLGLESVHLCGNSLGGWIAAEFAAFYPERVTSLTLIAPAGMPGTLLFDSASLEPAAMQERLLNGQASQYREYLDEGPADAAAAQGDRERQAKARLMGGRDGNSKLARRLGRLRVPTQVLLPEEDRVHADVAMRSYADAIPGATVEVIHGERAPTAHLLIIQEPELVAAQTLALLLGPPR